MRFTHPLVVTGISRFAIHEDDIPALKDEPCPVCTRAYVGQESNHKRFYRCPLCRTRYRSTRNMPQFKDHHLGGSLNE